MHAHPLPVAQNSAPEAAAEPDAGRAQRTEENRGGQQRIHTEEREQKHRGEDEFAQRIANEKILFHTKSPLKTIIEQMF